MLRLVAATLALTGSLGGLYGGVVVGVGDGELPTNAPQESDNYITELVATPLIENNRIRGYVIGRYLVEIDRQFADAHATPLAETIAHGVNSYFYSHARDMFWVGGAISVPDIAQGLQTAINAQVGFDLVTAIAIRQLDYLQPPEVRQPVISFDR